MKKLQVLFLCALILLSLYGCVNTGKEATSINTSLTIYYPKNNVLYTQGINEFITINPNITLTATEFPTAQKMDEQLRADMETGILPDVMLFDENTLLNIPQMAADGVFFMVDEYIADDAIFQSAKDQYLFPAMESGKFLGKQSILPFSFKLPCLFGNVDKVSELALYDDNYTLEGLFELLEYNIEQIKDDSENCTIFQLEQDSILKLMLRVSGVQISNYAMKDMIANPEEVERIADFAKIIRDEQTKAMTLANKYSRDVASFVPRSLFFLWSSVNLPYDAWSLQSYYKISETAKLKVYPLPLMNSSEIVNATISQYGAVAATSINKSGAYHFLRFLMDYNGTSKDREVFGMPIYMMLLNQNIEALGEKSVEVVISGSKVEFEPLSIEYKAYIEELLSKIGQCKLPEAKIEQLFDEAFKPYIENDVLFEDCYASFSLAVDQYLNEPINYMSEK